MDDHEERIHNLDVENYPDFHRPLSDNEWESKINGEDRVEQNFETFVNPILLTKKTYEYIDNFEDVKRVAKFLDDIVDTYETARFALDVETYSQDPNLPSDVPSRPIKIPSGWLQGMIKTIQIGVDPEIHDIQFIIDIEKIGKPKEIGDLLRHSIESATIIGQNLKYDYQFIYTHMGLSPKKMRDLMLLGQIEKAGDKMSHNLSSLYGRYLNPYIFKQLTGLTFEQYTEFKKETQKSAWRGELSEVQLRYASHDVRLVFPTFNAMCDSIDKFIDKYEKYNKPHQSIINTIYLECELIPVYAMMELRGVSFDVNHHKGVVIPFLEGKMEEAEKAVGVYFKHQVKKSNGLRGKAKEIWYEDETININSVKQLKESLIEAGVPLPNEKSTASETLDKLQNFHPSIPWILQYKKASSLLSKFGQKMIDICVNYSDHHVIYANWFQIGSDDTSIDTGRSSCQSPNLQQIPARDDKQIRRWGQTAAELFRSSFIARAGTILIDADFSQIEPRIQAEMCDEESQIVAFQEADKNGTKVDLHALIAKAAFGLDFLPTDIEIDRLKKLGEQGDKEAARLAVEYKRFRDAGKILNLGIGYGMGSAKLARKITEETGQECSNDKAKNIISTYYTNLPGIKATKAELEQKIHKTPDIAGTLAVFLGRKPIAVEETIDGRPRRWCLKIANPNQEDLARSQPDVLARWYNGGRYNNEFNNRLSEVCREAYNFKIQGTCADILKKSLVLVHNRFIDLGLDPSKYGILMVVHDEILAEVPLEMKEQCAKIVKDSMIEAAQTVLKRVPPLVTLKTGANWAIAH